MNSRYRYTILAVFVLITGCAGSVKSLDVKLPYNNGGIEGLNDGNDIAFTVENDKRFSGGPSSIFGAIHSIDVDLETIQIRCAKEVIGKQVNIYPESKSKFKVTSSIDNFSWVVENIGLFGQAASVSFDLSIAVAKGGKELLNETVEVRDYYLEEAQFQSYADIVGLAWGNISRADNFALSAFILTSLLTCESYKETLEILR